MIPEIVPHDEEDFFNSMNTSELVKRADKFAEAAHARTICPNYGTLGHKRKYTEEPYIGHPRAVAKTIDQIGGTSEQIAAALLHDTVEDTDVTIDDIYEEFGDTVGKYVADVTDVSKPEDGNRKIRKELDSQHIAAADPDSKTIKLADVLDNGHSIEELAPKFARVYMSEMLHLLSDINMGNVTSRHLLALARKMVSNYYDKINVEVNWVSGTRTER